MANININLRNKIKLEEVKQFCKDKNITIKSCKDMETFYFLQCEAKDDIIDDIFDLIDKLNGEIEL